MNVATVASAFHPHTGGVEEVCRQLVGEQRRRGLGVLVLTNRWPRSLPRSELIDGVPVRRLALRVAGDSLKSKVTAVTRGLIRREMVGVLRRFQPDLLHVQCVSANAEYAMAARARLGVPLVVSLHGELTVDASHLFQRSAWAQGVLRASLDRADAITACSGQTLAEAEAWYGKPFGDRGRVVYNGVSMAVAHPWPHPRPYLLGIGRHVHQKGFDLLLRAVAQLAATNPTFDHDLILAGDGTEHQPLRALADQLGLAGRVHFPGRVDHPTATRLFAGCSFFVLASRHEPFGIVNLEAMAAGRAIVATRVGGVPEIVADDVNGVLVPPEDVNALAAAIGRLAADPAARDRLGTEGHRVVQRFTWAAIADQYMTVYADATRAYRSRRGPSIERAA